jgi:hypothetical protein
MLLMAAIEEGGSARDAANCRRPCGEERGAELGVEDAPDRWAPPVGDHVREREGSGALASLLGRKRGAGPLGEWAGEEMGRRWKKKKREERWAAGWVWG